MEIGKFIVIEGLDGSGKTTQTNIITEKLKAKGINVINQAEPTPHEFGRMCREVLGGRKKVTKSQFALLFTADRIDHNLNPEDGINMHIGRGDTVISDRYYYSTLAYQGVDVGLDWLMSLNLGCEDIRKPDLCIFLDLLPEKLRSIGLFPCGRLDKNTLGVMLLMNNGDLGHKLLSPRYHVSKVYRYTAKNPLSAEDISRLESGVSILDRYITKPARVMPYSDKTEGEISITEGKYHQIKLMFEAVDNKITRLERIRFGPLSADDTLPRGEWRYLTDEEIEALENHCK